MWSDFAVNKCLHIVASSWTFLLTLNHDARNQEFKKKHILELRHVLDVSYWTKLLRLLLTFLVWCFYNHYNFIIMDKTSNLFINFNSSTPELLQCNIIFTINTAVVKADILLLVPDALWAR